MSAVTDATSEGERMVGLTRDEFVVAADGYRRELLAHCYKMVGSIHEAEDLVQETYVRAWRGWDSFEGRSSARTWLYRIATNLCLTVLASPRSRVVPAGLTGSWDSPLDRTGMDALSTPFPTGPFDPGGDPAQTALERAGLRLALVASLQVLPARQRAVFILREALGYPAAEIAGMLDMSTVAVKSALQRARATLDEVAPRAEEVTEPTDAVARQVLETYMLSFQSADIDRLTRLLKAETVLTVRPTGLVIEGNTACLLHLRQNVLTSPDLYRMTPTSANGQPAVIAYHRSDAAGPFAPFGVAVLTLSGDRISRIDTFTDPALVTAFGASESAPQHSRDQVDHAGICARRAD